MKYLVSRTSERSERRSGTQEQLREAAIQGANGNEMTEGFFVYILASRRNGTLYVGVTNDLARRIAEHKAGLVPGFTRKYGVNKLVHVDAFSSILEARRTSVH
jgi:putative endonuclease